MDQIPTLGRIVQYRLNATDAEQINRRRTSATSIAARLATTHGSVPEWPAGAQAHIGNEVREGDIFPMLITRVWGSAPESAVNGQVFLDGNDTLWVTSVIAGQGARSFFWPART